jgi:membrane-bound lytic murein transglycosylase D
MERRWTNALVVGLALAGTGSLTAYAVSGEPEYASVVVTLPAENALPAAARWDLPVKRTARVAHWERVLAGPERQRMRTWLERSSRYTPMIRRQLRARGMPQDLVYLPLVESGFSPDASSPARAVGLWQLMAHTSRLLGLEVTRYVDQRRDPVAATGAALDFLQDLHAQFGSWWLAAAAYNCGPGCVERALQRVVGRTHGDDETYWKIAPYLPRETREYVPRLLAAGEIAKQPRRFGFTDLRYRLPLQFDSVRVPGGTRLSTVTQATGADSAVIDRLNLHLVRDMTPPGKVTTVRIPRGLRQAFLLNFPRELAAQRAAAGSYASTAGE